MKIKFLLDALINTGLTLSPFISPGEDKRINNSKSPSILTFGDFRVDSDLGLGVATGDTRALQFDGYSTMESLNGVTIKVPEFVFVSERELNSSKEDPLFYAYYGSFYTAVATAINNIATNYPYAILCYDDGGQNSIINYSQFVLSGRSYSEFSIPTSAVTNQGGVILGSGTTIDGTVSLYNNPNFFCLQLSGTNFTDNPIYDIVSYNYITTGSSPYLKFRVKGYLLNSTTATTSNYAFWIRPSKARYNNYLRSLESLENHLLHDGYFILPSEEETNILERRQFVWPRSIDGFNPDISGQDFEDYQEEILLAARNLDQVKTELMVRTMVPDNFIELDTSSKLYANLIQTHAYEFDEIKKYIDNLAYAYTTSYNGVDSVPNKFLSKLGKLLGWELRDGFSEVDIFEYLAGDDDNTVSYAEYNLEIWRKILVNIVWLYKKKGTRDALTFLFKLAGAPECLVSIDEFVYKINKTNLTTTSGTTQPVAVSSLTSPTPGIGILGGTVSFGIPGIPGLTGTSLGAPIIPPLAPGPVNPQKVDDDGFINYDASRFIFQEGGEGRGNGEAYIEQWRPEFDPIKTVDNIKVYSGDPAINGTRDTINSKELCVSFSPAQAIECDVFAWFKQSGTCWVWGSTAPAFTALTVPFEMTPEDCGHAGSNVTGLTFSQWLKLIYSSKIDPTCRKTLHQSHTSFFYPELKKLYLYYYYSTNPVSNALTFGKLESLLDLLQLQLDVYAEQLIPATTILECNGTVYRNTIFNRQKFVYKNGINTGSEFQVPLPPNPNPQIILGKVEMQNIRTIAPEIKGASIELKNISTIKSEYPLNGYSIRLIVNTSITTSIGSGGGGGSGIITLTVEPSSSSTTKGTFPPSFSLVGGASGTLSSPPLKRRP